MLMRTIPRLTAAVLAGCISAAVPAAAQDAVRIGTSSVGSTFYIVANGIGDLLYKRAGINVTVEPIGGSSANIFGVSVGNLDYAIVNSGAAYTAVHGEVPFKEPIKVTLIAQGDTSFRHILARRDADVKDARDLAGHIMIGERPAMPEIKSLSSALVSAAGLGDKGVNIVSTSETNEAVDQLRLGTVQAAILPGGAKVPSVVQLFRDGVTDYVYLSDAEVAEMKKHLAPYLFTRVLPAGHFEGQEKDATVFGLNTYLVAGPNVSEDQAYEITKTLFENHEEFAAFHSSAKEWTVENTLTDPTIPFNAGAIRYFKEKGAWTPEMEARQAELLAGK